MHSAPTLLLALTSEHHNGTVPQRGDCTDWTPTAQICIIAIIWGKNMCEETVCSRKTSRSTRKSFNYFLPFLCSETFFPIH